MSSSSTYFKFELDANGNIPNSGSSNSNSAATSTASSPSSSAFESKQVLFASITRKFLKRSHAEALRSDSFKRSSAFSLDLSQLGDDDKVEDKLAQEIEKNKQKENAKRLKQEPQTKPATLPNFSQIITSFKL